MIEIVRADITTIAADAIVNAANESLGGGGGVDGTIHWAAGPDLLLECARHGTCRTGDAVLTHAYRLPARYVIHAVGPVWSGGNAGERALLERTYSRAFDIARQQGDIRSIAFPAISTGAYAFPKQPAAEIALRVMQLHESGFDRIIAALFDDESVRLYDATLSRLRDPAEPPPFPVALWRTYADTVLELVDAGQARIDLRQPITDDIRALLASVGLDTPFAVITAEFPHAYPTGHLDRASHDASTALTPQSALEARLALASAPLRRVDGVSPAGDHRERSVAVALDHAQAEALAREFRQHALFWFDGNDFWLCPTHPRIAPRRLPLEEL